MRREDTQAIEATACSAVLDLLAMSATEFAGIHMVPGFTEISSHHGHFVYRCRIPDDCIDSKRYPLFMARDVMRVLIEQLQAEGATPS